ncbi:MAG: type II toxin-antitoxin system prevent-host-death family antitoxin [Deltaproteobacteria bacterium]|nr:type II toxin-antitoxin system prevent-host-death family antitoxin [Deltaproteobacteria bacterium]
MKATAKDLRLRTRAVLAAVDRGESVVVTHRGKQRAEIVPIRERRRERDATTELFGIWADREELADVDGYVRALREGRE